jgi:hypothetical protein
MTRSASSHEQGCVAIVADQAVAGELAGEIGQLVSNLQRWGYSILSYEVSGGTPEELRALLRDAHTSQRIEGALLIGSLPVAWFQVKDDFGQDGYAEWPVDLFYMDLDGTWLDTMRYDPHDTLVPGHDGVYDVHTGNLMPEIYVGRLMPNGLGDSLQALRNYFRKDNAFRHDTIALVPRALVFVDDDWQSYAPEWSRDVGILYPERTTYTEPETTRAPVYRRNLDTVQAWVSVFAHSWSHGHGFYYNQHRQMDYYYGSEYTTQDPPANFYNHFACSFGRYTDTGYGAGRSIFNPNYGLAAVASTKSGGMLDFSHFYAPLARGQTLGMAFREWFSYITAQGIGPAELCWFYGMTLLGDPFLRPSWYPDVGISEIRAPAAAVDSGAIVVPQVVVYNAGSDSASFSLVFRVGTDYRDIQMVSDLASGDSEMVAFVPWAAVQNGTYPACCSVLFDGDLKSANDTISRRVTVRRPDVAVVEIVAPKGMVDTSRLTPQATVCNFGPAVETFWTYFRICDTSRAVVYLDSARATALRPGVNQTLNFPEWSNRHTTFNHLACAYTAMPGDRNRGNDSAWSSFTVLANPPPDRDIWVLRAGIPAGPRARGVKDGGALACGDDGMIYALKGNSTVEFYRYDPLRDNWQTRESLPRANREGRKRTVKKGGSLAAAAGRVYALKGGQTLDFWEYDGDTLGTGRWSQRSDVPLGRSRIRGGAGLTTVNRQDTIYVYLLKGSGTCEFYRYDPRSDVWQTLHSAPVGISGKGFKKGSCLTSDGVSTVYALKGGTNELFAYDIASDSWARRAGLPLVGGSGKRRKSGDGASLVYHGGRIHALKGGNTLEFWCYRTWADVWIEDDDLPVSGGKKVKAGGGLAFSTGALFALKGNKTHEFLIYVPSAIGDQPSAAGVNVVSCGELRAASYRLWVAPNPCRGAAHVGFSLPEAGKIGLRLYDVTGELVTTLASGFASAGNHVLAVSGRRLGVSGVYLLRLETDRGRIARKIVVR